MRAITQRLLFVGVVGSLVLGSAHYFLAVVRAQERTPASLTRIFTGPDGQTHAERVNVKLAPTPPSGRIQSSNIKAKSAYIVRLPVGFVQDWHPVAERRYVITLTGKGEIELVGGQKILLEPGRILQAEDLTGKGHLTRTLGNEDWTVFFVQYDK